LWGILLSRAELKDTFLVSHLKKEEVLDQEIEFSTITDVIHDLLSHVPEARIIVLTCERGGGAYHNFIWCQDSTYMLSVLRKFNPRLINQVAYIKIKGESVELVQKELIDAFNKKGV
jgi:hypothetical protein